MASEMRAGNVTESGGLYISMAHLGPESVAARFKGMVERCRDCGFDLAGGLVEVVPTAHYMMGGVAFEPDTTTALPGLYAAGEDTGGVHGANRLGGNGVANSTVYGGIAGDRMAADAARERAFPDPDEAVLEAAAARCLALFDRPPGDLSGIRDRLSDLMWDEVGILLSAESLERADAVLADLAAEVEAAGAPGGRAFNLAWHDRLNLESLVTVSRAITAAARAREDSRGAHYREDFPETGDLAATRYTAVRLADGAFAAASEPVAFTHVRPGESLLDR